jgi:hypothetical protein
MGSGGADKHQSAANNSLGDVGDEDGDPLEKRERGDPWTDDEQTLLRELIASEGTGPASFAASHRAPSDSTSVVVGRFADSPRRRAAGQWSEKAQRLGTGRSGNAVMKYFHKRFPKEEQAGSERAGNDCMQRPVGDKRVPRASAPPPVARSSTAYARQSLNYTRVSLGLGLS